MPSPRTTPSSSHVFTFTIRFTHSGGKTSGVTDLTSLPPTSGWYGILRGYGLLSHFLPLFMDDDWYEKLRIMMRQKLMDGIR
jgi:hypothetical protein